MAAYQFTQNAYILPTPAGAFYAVSTDTEDKARYFLLSLLAQASSQAMEEDFLVHATASKNAEEAMELLYRAQGLGWVQGEEQPREAPVGILEEALPAILGKLSSSRKVLLVDNQGLFLSAHGFSYELAEELSALSADLSSLYLRHQRLLKNNINISSSAWALVNSHGDSELGIWPLYVGGCQFNLVLMGAPQFNQQAFVDLIWILSKRYLDLPDSY